MAFLAVSAPLNHCRNPSEELHGRCRQELLSKPMFQGNPLKKPCRQHHLHLHLHHPQQQQDMAIFASVSFPSFPSNQQSSGSSLSPSILTGPSSSAGREVYQPFRPPPAVALENLSIDEQLEILRDRRGMWFDYAVHVPSLIRAGLTPSMIDEATGVTGVEQNKIVVAAQVRSSLQASGMEESMLSFYDIGGADLLYELRIISSKQRKAAATYALMHKMQPKEYRELARSMKDYERHQREEGWESFAYSPGDCLAYSCYRLSKEVKNDAEKESFLQMGIKYAETEKAKQKLMAFLEKGEENVQDEQMPVARLQVIRLSSSEAGAGAGIPSISYVLPVVEPNVQEFEAAPLVSRKGPFTIQNAENAWKTWVSLPAWEPLATAVVPVAISLPNSTLLPWKQKSKELEEPLIMVADKHVKAPHADAYYVVELGDGKLALQLGTVVLETRSRVLGKAVLALRPPLPEEDDLNAIEWD